MAVYTHVSSEDLSLFLKDYEIGELIEFEGISEGVENTNYKLKTEKEAFDGIKDVIIYGAYNYFIKKLGLRKMDMQNISIFYYNHGLKLV